MRRTISFNRQNVMDHDLDTSPVDWAIDYPASQTLFRELGIDCNCGGKSLRTACRERGYSPEDILARLQRLVASTQPPPG